MRNRQIISLYTSKLLSFETVVLVLLSTLDLFSLSLNHVYYLVPLGVALPSALQYIG